MPETRNPPILPPPLSPGDTIGLAPLAGPWQPEPYEQGMAILRQMGFRLKTEAVQAGDTPFLAAPDQVRADLFQRLCLDPEVKAILACRGGYGSMRLLPLLNFDIIRQHQKIIIGFSDITALLNTISQRTGLVTFHGPNLTTLPATTASSQRLFQQLLTSSRPKAMSPSQLKILQDGKAEGELVGGNLTTLTHLLATPFEPDWRGKIVFLEDVGEAPYRIDRLISQLFLAGKFKEVRGLILGQFSNCGEVVGIWQRFTELVGGTIPIWANFPFGHGKDNQWLPIGLTARMESEQGQLVFTGFSAGQ